MRQIPWKDDVFYSPKEVGAFFGRGDDWARDQFRDESDVVQTRAKHPRRILRDDYVTLAIPGWVITRWYLAHSGRRAA